MKILMICLLFFIKLTQSYKIPNPELPVKQCLRVTLNEGQYHTIFIDHNNDTDTLLKDCIIKKIHKNQSIQLVRGLISRPRKMRLPSNKPNLIVMTKSLNHEFLDGFCMHPELKLHWNMLYIVVIGNDTYKCKDGKFDENTFSLIKHFMNDFWQKFEIPRLILLFPYSCPQAYAIYGKQLLTDRPLYNRTVRVITPKTFKELSRAIIKSSENLSHGYPVRASIFQRFPTTIRSCDKIHDFLIFNKTLTNGFCGTDGLMMYETIQHFKFNVTISKDPECNKYGYVDCEKKVATGSLGCIVHNKVDISFNSRFLVLYTKKLLNYLHYVTHDYLCPLLPVPDIYPIWHYPHMPLNLNHCISFVFIVFILSSTAWISAIIKNKFTDAEVPKFKSCIFDFTTCALFGFSMKKYCKFYLLRSIALALSIIFTTYYQGYINYTFTTLTRYSKIKTIAQLYDSDYVLYTSASVRELLKSLEKFSNEKQEKFFNRTKLQDNTDIGIVLQKKNSVTLGRDHDARSEILLRYRDKDGKPLIYVVDECFCAYYLSYVSRFDFLFTKELKIFMERMLQAGLPPKYYQWTRRTFHLPDTLPRYGPEARPISTLSILDLKIPIGILLTGYTMSALIFAGELWLHRRVICFVL